MTGERQYVEEPLSDARCAECGSNQVTKTVAERGPPAPASHRAGCQDCGHRGPVAGFLAEADRVGRPPAERAALDEHLARSRDRQADAEVDHGVSNP